MSNYWIFRKLETCSPNFNAATKASDHVFPKCLICEKKVFPAVADAIILGQHLVLNRTLRIVALGVSDVATSAE